MANPGLRLFCLALLLPAATWLLEGAAPAQSEVKPIKVVIKLPEKAELYIDGSKTQQTGKARVFETRPVRVGVDYYFHVKGVWKGADGKDVVKVVARFLVRPEKNNELDLLAEEKPARPVAQLQLTAPGAVAVATGGRASVTLKIDRLQFSGPVKVAFAGVPGGVKLADLTIPADKSAADVELAATSEARIGTAELVATAEAGALKSEAKITLSITEPLTAKLTLICPSVVDVAAGQRKTIRLRIIRTNCKGPIKLAFAGGSLKVPEVTIDEDKSEVRVELVPSRDARVGPVSLETTATGVGARARFDIHVNILAAGTAKEN